MAPLSLRIISEGGVVTRTVMFDSNMTVRDALKVTAEKMHMEDETKEYGLFQMSTTDPSAGIWLENSRPLEHYMLRDGDSLHFLARVRTVRVKLLDGSVKTVQVDESKQLIELMPIICQKIGVADHDEYGLCEEEPAPDEGAKDKETKVSSTLKRKAQTQRDAKMEELSKKLRTDDNVKWLDPHKTLREMGVDPQRTLVLKRRLFYSDRKVDSRDPVQLNLLYVQTRNAILEGHHPVTEEQALKFAGLQCQIQHGDHDEEKHKPGLIENLAEYLPAQYASSRSVEKKILKLHKQHQGLSPVDARMVYIKTARDLPTYGVTFFLVKEVHKDKKKMVPRLLGISSEAVLRLDETTKEVIQTWPLTQVLRYRAGHNHTFMLDFGDYSDKQYTVRTHDADRICDILRGYIDLISKKISAGAYNVNPLQGGVVTEDCVEYGRGNEMTVVSQNSKKPVEESFIGSSKIVSYEPGEKVQQGTQIMTVQQVLITNKGSTQQQAVSGEVPIRKDMSLDFVRKLNKMNSNSVKIVSLLADSSKLNINDAQKIISEMEMLMPDIRKGVKETVQNQTDDEERKKLLRQLEDLDQFMNSISHAAQKDDRSLEEIEEAAKQLADLSTQMYFSLDPRTRKRSVLLKSSRTSFIQDEKMEATLKRASLIAAAGQVTKSIDSVKGLLLVEYQGPALDRSQVEHLEAAAVDKLGKINAAVALYLSAYADATNVDYSTAVTSMNTINELTTELAKDAQALASVRDGKFKDDLFGEMTSMLEALKHVTTLTGADDHKKMQETATEFAEVSGRLIYTFGRSTPKLSADKENEIMDLTTEACNMTTLLLVKANTLTELCQSDPGADDVDSAGVQCANAASDLMLTAQLTSPSISEAHCRSALTASVETVSSASAKLAHAWRPLAQAHAQRLSQLEGGRYLMEELELSTRQLDQALEKLKQSYAGFEDTENAITGEEQSPECLRFIVSMNAVKDGIKLAKNELDEEYRGPRLDGNQVEHLEAAAVDKLGKINAAVALYLSACADATNVDYSTAVTSMNTINELTTELAKDAQALASVRDGKFKDDLFGEMTSMLEALKHVTTLTGAYDHKKMQETATEFAEVSGRLIYTFGRSTPKLSADKENEIMDLTTEACNMTTLLLVKANTLTELCQSDPGADDVDSAGVQCANAASDLMLTAQLTSPSISEAHCRSALTASVETVSSASAKLAHAWRPLAQAHAQQLSQLEGGRYLMEELELSTRQLDQALEKLKQSYAGFEDTENAITGEEQSPECLRFIVSMNAVKDGIKLAKNELDEEYRGPRLDGNQVEHLEAAAVDKLGKINAAVALYLSACADATNVDYSTAVTSMNTINELTTELAKDAQALASVRDGKFKDDLFGEMTSMLEALKHVTTLTGADDHKKMQETATEFAEASGRLIYTFGRSTPKLSADKENEIMDLTTEACNTTTLLLVKANMLTELCQSDPGADGVDSAGVQCANAASDLMLTAQLTSPSISEAHCRSALTASVETVSSASAKLAHAWRPLAQAHAQRLSQLEDGRYLMEELESSTRQLDQALEKLKQSYAGFEDTENAITGEEQSPERLRFIVSMNAVKDGIKLAEKELDEPMMTEKLDKLKTEQIEKRLAGRIAQINAAVASLVQAISDPERPNHEVTELALTTISESLPAVAKDVHQLGHTAAVKEDIREWYRAVDCICSGLNEDGKNLDDPVENFAKASDKLRFVFSTAANRAKKQLLLELTEAAHGRAMQMAAHSYKMADTLGGQSRQRLNRCVSKLETQANTLRNSMQITSLSISSPHCQTVVVSSVDAVEEASQELVSEAFGVQDDETGCKVLTKELNSHKEQIACDAALLQKSLGKIKDVCLTAVESSEDPTSKSIEATENFLQNERENEVMIQKKEEEKQRKYFKELVQNVNFYGVVRSALQTAVSLGPADTKTVCTRFEDALARASVAASKLVAAHYAKKKDYTEAAEAVKKLSELVPEIARDGVLLSKDAEENTKHNVQEDLGALCTATQNLCYAATENTKMMDDAALSFGGSGARLRFILNRDFDPQIEKEVISQAKDIGDGGLKVTQGCAAIYHEGRVPHMRELTEAMGNSTRMLVFTSKILAPSIEHPECQFALKKTSQDMSSLLGTIQTTLQNIDSENKNTRSIISKTSEEALSLDERLQSFKSFIEERKMVEQKEEFVVDENGLRKLTDRIVEHAKQMSEMTPHVKEKAVYAQYADKLIGDIKVLDLVNHKCRNAMDLHKYKQVEGAVQQLQMSVLQNSPALRGKPQSNIIDLTEFTKSVSTELKKLMDTAQNANATLNEKSVSEIIELGHRMLVAAFKITNPPAVRVEDETTFGDMVEVNQFAEDCDNKIDSIEELIKNINDQKTKEALQQRVLTLTEACNLIRFASKSALAAAQGATLEETLNDLEEIDKRIDALDLAAQYSKVTGDELNSARDEAKMSLQSAAVALCSGKALDLPTAVTKYAVQCRGSFGAQQHVKKILQLLTLSCGAASSRLAVWEPPAYRVKPLVQAVLKELDEYARLTELRVTNKPVDKIVTDADANKLLFPVLHTKKFDGDNKQLEANLKKSANKLSSLASTILSSATKPESLSRTVNLTVEAALNLAQLANASESQDPIHRKEVEEISQDMCVATYKLLKSAEALSQDPKNSEYKRKLLGACRSLNDLIDKLTRRASTAEKLQKDCNELQRRLQTEQNGLQMSYPVCALPYSDCLEAFNAQEEIINTLNSDESMTRDQFAKSLSDVAANVCNTAQFAAHCGYLLSISEQNKELAQTGLIDTARVQKLSACAQESCLKILRATQYEEMQHEVKELDTHLENLQETLKDISSRLKGDSKTELDECASEIDEAAKAVHGAVDSGFTGIHLATATLLNSLAALKTNVEEVIEVPSIGEVSSETKDMVEEINSNCKNLLSKTQKLLKEVNAADEGSETMTWVTYGTSRKDILDAFQRLANSLRKNGQARGLIAEVKSEEVDEEVVQKNYVQMQVVLANKWLQRKPLKPELQRNGEKSVWILIELGKELWEDLTGQERQELGHLISDCEHLVNECSKKYDQEKAATLMDRVRELSKAIERGAVNRVVEDFADAEEPLQDLDTLVDEEKDEAKRKFLLEQKIAELLAQLGKVTRTARFVAATTVKSPAASEELKKYSGQVELLAPKLVQAAEARVKRPQDGATVDHYKALLAQYTESLSKVRELCDASVDPMDFVQTAGDTMQRMRETSNKDPQKCIFTSLALQRLANRVIMVGLSSPRVQKEPDLQKALKEAQARLLAPPPARASRIRDWDDAADEILRTTGEVESALGGEMIFKRQPEPDQPIYQAAHGLHAAVREWSARDNELVAVAKRVAVLMANLAGHVETDAKRELISTSKSIVSESHEVARLARKLAVECTDIRIQTNLLQVCERIPTISGQLKMLTTVKASSFGRQGTDEDKEAMNMLICNAQNLMSSVQEVVKAAASASVKILSQRGPRVRWVRRQYY